ncbi:uncharacterized protein LOC123469355 isoform X1 [Daphnia magna]|nr:uncharacterized protein LOC123469355 isoform X1 [Daphnia magna]
MATFNELQQVYLEYTHNLLPGTIGLSFPDFCTGYNVFTEQPAFPALHGANEEQAATNYRKIPVDVEQLKDYLACDFKIHGISVLMQISEPTLKRRIKEYGLSIRGSYSNISDNDLDIVIANVLKRFPKFGLQLLQGKLVADGYKLQEKRLRASYARIGLKKAKPGLKQIPRVVYHADSPLQMWHMDGFHKFDGWGFVVHGIVDGYSKAIVGMQVSDNNRSETVVKLLHSSCIIWGTPACLRTDRGGENVLAADYMLNVRGVDRSSFYAGSSMRNQRIERQWRDTNQFINLNNYLWLRDKTKT